MSIKETETGELIAKVAAGLEKISEISPPEWSRFVKTGVHKERPPEQENWWYIRAASTLRKIYIHPGIGVAKLRKIYGGRKNRGHKPEHKYKASGKILREIVHQLEKAELVKNEKGKGRFITKKGMAFLNSVAESKTKTREK
jgi:small subunit ribosomal protein S19e